MSFVSTPTLIPLHRAAVHLGIDPWHFSQIYTSNRPFKPSCSDDWYQYDWQSQGKLSREDLAFALRQAEDMAWQYLNWSALPRWHEEEVMITPHYRVEMYNIRNAQDNAKSVTTQWGHVLEVGKKTSTYIDSPATVFSDPDGDGIDELVTISFVTTVTDEEELHVYYPDKDGRDEWEIRPLTTITIAAGTATITFPKYLVPLEELIIRPASDDEPHVALNGDDNTQFLVAVDVYRVYADTSQQATIYYSPDVDCSETTCAADSDTACLHIKNERLGILQYTRADWDEDAEAYTAGTLAAIPVKLKIYYRAGRLDSRQVFPELQMNQSLERMIVYFALSMLDTQLCGCANTSNIWQFMTQDMSLITDDKRFVVPWGDLGNPLGTSRAAIRLWKYIHNIKVGTTPNPY